MNRKLIQTETLLTKIQNQLFEPKKQSQPSSGIQPIFTVADRSKLVKPQPKKKSNIPAQGYLSNTQAKSRSSEKATGKSSSFENLFSKKPGEGRKVIGDSDKLHQSFSHQINEQHSEQKNATKSLYFTETLESGEAESKTIDKSQPQPQVKKNMKINDYFQRYPQLLNKNTGQNGKNAHPPIDNLLEAAMARNRSLMTSSQFQEFKIQDVNSLIDLIDNCVQEANEYIRSLAGKVQTLQEQLDELKRINRRLDESNRVSQGLLKEKEELIGQLQQEKNKKSTKNEDLKNLLRMIDQLNEENASLRLELDNLRTNMAREPSIVVESERKQHKGPNPSPVTANTAYSQIHKKIEILNIAVNQQGTNDSQTSDTSSSKGQERQSYGMQGRNSMDAASRKYRFIKPKV